MKSKWMFGALVFGVVLLGAFGFGAAEVLTGWREVNGYARAGKRYRVSFDDPGTMTKEQIAAYFANLGATVADVYTARDDAPKGWPSDDRKGSRARVELTANRDFQLAPVSNTRIWEHDA